MWNAIATPPDGWCLRVIGPPSDIQKIAAELGPVELNLQFYDGALYLKPLSSVPATSSEWRGYEFARLLSAAARLRFGILGPIQLAPVDHAEMGPTTPSAPLALSQILNIARRREQIRQALLSYAEGGAAGLFQAYEAICHEIMSRGFPNYADGGGTKEWMIQQGWIADDEDDRFLKTVQHFRQGDGRELSFDPFSPYEAQSFVRKVLIYLIEYCCSANTSDHLTYGLD